MTVFCSIKVLRSCLQAAGHLHLPNFFHLSTDHLTFRLFVVHACLYQADIKSLWICNDVDIGIVN